MTKPPVIRRGRYLENHDGDTVTVLLDQGFYDMKQINLRLASVWAPETDEEGGDDVREFIARWFRREIQRTGDSRWDCVVHTHTTSSGREKKTLDRFVADVMSADGLRHLNSDVMKYIAEKGYSGGVGSPEKAES